MQRALSAALTALRREFEGKSEQLKQESRVLRMARALDEEMPPEEIGHSIGAMLKDEDTRTDAKIRLTKIAVDLAQAADVKTAESNIAGVEFEDLKAALYESALDMLLKDEGFFLSVAYQVFQSKPELWEQLKDSPPSRLINVKVSDG